MSEVNITENCTCCGGSGLVTIDSGPALAIYLYAGEWANFYYVKCRGKRGLHNFFAPEAERWVVDSGTATDSPWQFEQNKSRCRNHERLSDLEVEALLRKLPLPADYA